MYADSVLKLERFSSSFLTRLAVFTPAYDLCPMDMSTSRGTFDIQLDRQLPHDVAEGISLGRATFTKQFQGDLDATSTGEMLTALTEVKGSAGYVASERITGKLHGQHGSFVVQHIGRMTRGNSELTISVVPDSGTGELKGIVGQMTIEVVERQHFYTITYAFEVVE
jgi:hypothetical protein